jgi:hypothetical protein
MEKFQASKIQAPKKFQIPSTKALADKWFPLIHRVFQTCSFAEASQKRTEKSEPTHVGGYDIS